MYLCVLRDHHTQVCNRCQKPRPENLAPREGRGRGFNERDDASDRRAPPPDEDDGYDDFGRRKKPKKSKAEREARRERRWYLQASFGLSSTGLVLFGF